MATAIIKASKAQLELVGIDYELTNMRGIVKGYYPSGYVQVEVSFVWEGFDFTYDFDIPRWWLKIEEDGNDLKE